MYCTVKVSLTGTLNGSREIDHKDPLNMRSGLPQYQRQRKNIHYLGAGIKLAHEVQSDAKVM